MPELNDRRVREIFADRYRLIYQVEVGVVSILAFIHGARDFDGRFTDRSSVCDQHQ